MDALCSLPNPVYYGAAAYAAYAAYCKVMSKGIRLRGSRVIVTGASEGIGAACAKYIASNGGEVILLARTKSKLDKVAAEIRAGGGTAHVFPTDCSDPEAVATTAAAIRRDVGTPDAIVNNAGAGDWKFLHEMETDEIRKCLEVPFFAAVWLTREFLPDFIERDAGMIVNVQSPVAHTAYGGASAYGCSRWALRGLGEMLRADVRGTGIGVREVVLAETHSNYFVNNPNAGKRIPSISMLVGKLTADEAGAVVARALESGEDTVVAPWRMDLTWRFAKYFPALVNLLVAGTGWSVGNLAAEQQEKEKKA